MDKFELLDIINILSFYIGIKNLDENLSQGKAAELLQAAVEDIHKHLAEQDDKLERIMEEINHDKNQRLHEADQGRTVLR